MGALFDDANMMKIFLKTIYFHISFQFSSFMWGGSRQVIKENLLGNKDFLGDRVQVAECGFIVVSSIVDICDSSLVGAFIIKSSRFCSPSYSFVMFWEVSWVTLGLSSKGVNTIKMMSYGWDEHLGGWWALSLTLGIKREYTLRIIGLISCQESLMLLLAKCGMKSTYGKWLFRPSRWPLLKSNNYLVVFLIWWVMLV